MRNGRIGGRCFGHADDGLLRLPGWPRRSASSVSWATRIPSMYRLSPMRRIISSSPTSSTWVWIHQTLPNGSRTRLPRSPQRIGREWGHFDRAGLERLRCTASQSSTYSVRKAGVSGHSSFASNIISTRLPIQTSAWPRSHPRSGPAPFLSAERLLQEVDERRGAPDDDVRRDGPIVVGDWPDRGFGRAGQR